MKCYCLEIFRAKFGDQVEGKCLRESCARWRREQRALSPYIEDLFERSDRAIKELKRKE
jgi:hypothetical protein